MSFCPKWIYEIACASAGYDFLSRQLDLHTVAKARAACLSEFYHVVNESEIAPVVDGMLRFLDELNAGESAAELLNGFCYQRAMFEAPNKPRKIKGFFGSADEPEKSKDYSAEGAVTSFRAYVYALRTDVGQMPPIGWRLSQVEDSDVLKKMATQDINPLDFL